MGNVRLYGATSGYTELAPPAVAPDGVLTLPSGTGTISKEKESSTASVLTQQGTTSTSYTDLATAGPSVTVTTGTKALVVINGESFNSTTQASSMSFAVSGATTIAAANDSALLNYGTADMGASQVFLLTSLTAGSNVFTAKYKVNGGTGTFANRRITVIDMGS